MASTFKQDLQRGMVAERIVLDDLLGIYPCATLVDAYKGYDIWIPEGNFGVEVKYDPASNDTGNFLVEYEMNNKPSALMATTAKLWAFYDDARIMYIKPRAIIKCIFDHKLTHRVITGPNDVASKKCFLIRKEDLYKYQLQLRGKA